MLGRVLVLFDLDNTIGDRAGAVRHWAIDFAARHGLVPEAVDWFLAADCDGYRDRHEVFTDFRREFGLEAAVDTLLDDYRRSVVERTRTTPGAAACLVALQQLGERWKRDLRRAALREPGEPELSAAPIEHGDHR